MTDPSTETIQNMSPDELYELLVPIARACMRGEQHTAKSSTEDLVQNYCTKFSHSLQDTASPEDRRTLIRCASHRMRQLIIDAGRARNASKRGGGIRPVSLDRVMIRLADGDGRQTRMEVDVEALDHALAALENEAPDAAEVFNALYFIRIPRQEYAKSIGVEVDEIERLRKQAKRRLESRLSESPENSR